MWFAHVKARHGHQLGPALTPAILAHALATPELPERVSQSPVQLKKIVVRVKNL